MIVVLNGHGIRRVVDVDRQDTKKIHAVSVWECMSINVCVFGTIEQMHASAVPVWITHVLRELMFV